MRTKRFYDLLEKRFTKEEIAEIERQASLEVDMLKSIEEESADDVECEHCTRFGTTDWVKEAHEKI